MNNKINVALAGVGCCASSFVQLIEKSKLSGDVPHGVMHKEIGGYSLNDVAFVAAFDVDMGKTGKDLSDAISTLPSVAVKHVEIGQQNVMVEVGPLLDGIGKYTLQHVSICPEAEHIESQTVVKRLKEVDAHVLICYLPTGSHDAVRMYARASAEAGTAFINATPEPVATDKTFQDLFFDANVPLLGDDVRSHFGATALHTALIELMKSRGLEITNTYQLNVGGNMDFMNLSDPGRSVSKQKSKRKALSAAGIDASNVAAGPNGYVKFLGDTKVCFLRLEATSILDSELSLELRLQVEDSPNSAGVIANAVRVAKVALDQSRGGTIDEVCSFLFKSPRMGEGESKSLEDFNKFVQASNFVKEKVVQ